MKVLSSPEPGSCEVSAEGEEDFQGRGRKLREPHDQRLPKSLRERLSSFEKAEHLYLAQLGTPQRAHFNTTHLHWRTQE